MTGRLPASELSAAAIHPNMVLAITEAAPDLTGFASVKSGGSDTEGMCFMDANRFDALAVTRSLSHARSRRSMLGGVILGTLGLLGVSDDQAVAAKDCSLPCHTLPDKKKRSLCRRKRKQCQKSRNPNSTVPVNPCAGKNWCIDRAQTCGPVGGYGKCLVDAFGGNICGELLFQAASCAECAPANCTNCQCVLAAGGGDRCNNGVNGADYVCVRPL